jgi:capsular polysaccharide biosynthesis protein
MNRGGSRKIFNMKGIMGAAMIEFRGFPWERIHPLPSFEKSAILFNGLQLLFTPHGAGLANTLFMQRGSVVCEVQGEREVSMFTDISRVTQVNHVVARIMEMKHHGGVGADMSVAVAMRVLGIGLSLLS